MREPPEYQREASNILYFLFGDEENHDPLDKGMIVYQLRAAHVRGVQEGALRAIEICSKAANRAEADGEPLKSARLKLIRSLSEQIQALLGGPED